MAVPFSWMTNYKLHPHALSLVAVLCVRSTSCRLLFVLVPGCCWDYRFFSVHHPQVATLFTLHYITWLRSYKSSAVWAVTLHGPES